MIAFNANHYVRLRLTDRGRTILPEIQPQLQLNERPDADGVMTLQLYRAMNVFGPYLEFCGVEPVFETEITLLRPEEVV